MNEVKKTIRESLDLFLGAFFGAFMGVFFTYFGRLIEETGKLTISHLFVAFSTFIFIFAMIIYIKVIRNQGYLKNFIQQMLFFLMFCAYIGALYFSFFIQ